MPSKRSSRSLFLSIISVAACSSGPAKPDAYCGNGGAPASGIVLAGNGFSITYGNAVASANNDCPDPSAPAGIVSLTIEAMPSDGSTGFFTLCVQRPDQLAGGLAFPMQVKLVDATGSASGCSFLPDRSMDPAGTVSATGVCKDGTSAAGFALTVDATTVAMKRTCGTTTDTVTATITGTVAVTGS